MLLVTEYTLHVLFTDIETTCSEDKQERDRFISLVSAIEVRVIYELQRD